MSSDNKKIEALFILEMLGRPPEHLVETLKEMIGKIKQEKGIEVKEEKINEPQLAKDQKDIYTTFAEIRVEVEGTMQLIVLLLKYMPAHFEIISPENINMTNNEWNELLNELARRLHGYDEVARVLMSERNVLEQKLKKIIEKEKKD